MSPDSWTDWCQRRVQSVREAAPVQFRHAALDALPPAAEAALRGWCEQVQRGTAAPLLLDGPVGTGKTFAAYACWFDLVAVGWTGAWRVTTETAYLRAERPDGDTTYATERLTADVLHLDDLAATPPTEWSRGALFTLIDYRWSHQLPTVVTTNLTGKHLADHLGERAASRLAQGVLTVTLAGKDRRR